MSSQERKTKIVATIGPASNDEGTLAALVEAGMDGVRLNFSHGTHADHELSARRARAVQAEAGRPLALIADLQGPKIRIGDLEAPRELQVGEAVVVAGEEQCGKDDLPVAPDVLGAVLEAGDEILIDDGHVRLRVERMQDAQGALRGRDRRARRAAQGRERAGGAAAGPVGDREGPRATSTSRSGSTSTTSPSRSSARTPTSRRSSRRSRPPARRHG